MVKKASKNTSNEHTAQGEDIMQDAATQAHETQTATPHAADEIAQRLAEAEAKITELNDKALRAYAESENTRRRAEQEIAKAKDFAVESFARDMISVLENLFRASDAIPEAATASDENLKNIKEGIEITKREMIGAMERHKIKRLDPISEKFDHRFHQAVTQVEVPDSVSGTVIQVIQAGYTIKERLLRPAMVVVAK